LLSVDTLNVEQTEELLKRGCNPNLSKNLKTGENCLHLLMYKFVIAIEKSRKSIM
jgi:hypothetical protein